MRLFRRQLEYKAEWFGSKLVVADEFYPSSKMCSACGHTKRNLDLSERVFVCENCHSHVDRDLNAAVNLEKLAVSCTESINACESREVHASRQVLGGEAGTKHHPEQSVSNG
jgi:putative transposase